MAVEVRDNSDRGRFEIMVDGEVAGYSEYDDETPGLRTFFHTVIDDRFQGQGLAGKLVAASLDETRTRALMVEPTCPYVRGYIEKHPDYLDLVPADRREEFGLSPA